MDTDSAVARAFETQPNTPARVQATPGDDVHMELADLRRDVASNTRQIRRNAMDVVRQGRGSAPRKTPAPRTTPAPRKRSYTFKPKPSQGRIWNASFNPVGMRRR